ncbi:MAG: sulfatase [Planctomycetes bacterium]|nr:sulfatase [Planctomycetota bacterium]
MNITGRKSLFVGSPWDRIHCIILLVFLFSPLFRTASKAACNQFIDQRPNVLFIIADDASPHFGNAYGCKWVKTPNIDKLASRGLVFDQCYTPTAKCAPSRSAILTGRNPWQLEDAANHQSQFPVKFVAFSEALSSAGIYVGGHGKIWGPGSALTEAGTPRSFGFLKKQTQEDFGAFLQNRPTDKPFFYWFGSHNPHRGYKKDSGLGAGKKLSDIDRVPKFWPDNEVVRSDMLDYALEVEAFDAEVGEILRLLEASGEASRTLVLVTSDNGMPFPRSKGHNYDISNRLPMVACWPTGIADPGRRVAEYVSFIDLAPTFLELFEIEYAKSGMASITGRSFVNLLKGQKDSTRDYVILGRERNDVLARPGTASGLGYPVRAIRAGKLFYIHNFESDRWPCGNPDLGLKDTDASPTKSWISDRPTSSPYWQWSFGKRPQEELYDLENDPDCIQNLAGAEQYKIPMEKLREKLFRELTIQSDPRVLGQGSIFDLYESPKARAAARRQAK